MTLPLPQTALSEGFGPAWTDLYDICDAASLDHACNKQLRRLAADAVDHLLALLDALDVETEDLEPDELEEPGGDDEPTLGAPERHPRVTDGYSERHTDRSHDARQTRWADGNRLDGEAEEDDFAEEDDPPGGDVNDTGEPLLGAPENHGQTFNQEHWAGGSSEGENDAAPDTRNVMARWRDRRQAHDLVGRAEALRRRSVPAAAHRDPDGLTPLRPGVTAHGEVVDA